MFKLLIADDERLDREGLSNQLNWRSYGISQVITAVNGMDALEKASVYKPDCLLTDVKMPGMNGIALVEKIRELLPDIICVFVSGYSEVDLLRSAIRLEALEYILKPVVTSELANVMERVSHRMLEKHENKIKQQQVEALIEQSQPLLREKLIRDLFFGVFASSQREMLNSVLYITAAEKFFSVIIAEIDNTNTFTNADIAVSSFENFIASLEVFEGNNKIFAIRLENFRYGLMYSSDTCFIEDNGRAEYAIEESARDICNKALDADFSVTVAPGIPVASVAELSISYCNAIENLSRKWMLGKGQALPLLKLEDKIPAENIKWRPPSVAGEIAVCIKNFDKPRAYHIINHFFDSLSTNKNVQMIDIKNVCMNIMAKIKTILDEKDIKEEEFFDTNNNFWNMLLNVETRNELHEWMHNVADYCIEQLEKTQTSGKQKLIFMIAKYIEENYSNDISLKEIAGTFHYSPNYLGAVLKEITGKGFNEYLLDVRMKKAAFLLANPCYKIYEIADMVGYKNVDAFSEKFKQYYGVSPKNYKT